MDQNAFSYADPGDPFFKRWAIGALEAATGRNRLRRLYYQRQAEGWGGAGFFQNAIETLSIDVRIDAQRLDEISKSGPLVVVSNHPFGALDGIILCALLERVRPDFRVLTNAVLLRAPEMREKMLPIDFTETGAARRKNVGSRARALGHLRSGGCVAIFPAGAVSTSPDFWGRQAPVDGPWTPYLARLVQAGRCPVVPVFFEGGNSRLFHIVSHISATARLALFFHEVNRRVGTTFPVRIGEAIPWEALAGFKDRAALVAEIRARTIKLGME